MKGKSDLKNIIVPSLFLSPLKKKGSTKGNTLFFHLFFFSILLQFRVGIESCPEILESQHPEINNYLCIKNLQYSHFIPIFEYAITIIDSLTAHTNSKSYCLAIFLF